MTQAVGFVGYARHGLTRVATTSLANMSLPLVGFLTAPLLARSLGDEGRGEYASLSGPLLIIGVLGTVGLQDAITSGLSLRQLAMADLIKVIRRWMPMLATCNFVLVAGFSAIVALGGGDITTAVAFFIVSGPAATIAGLLHGVALGAGWLGIVNLNRLTNALVRAIVLPAAFLFGVLDLHLALFVLAGSQVLATTAMAVQLRRRSRSTAAVAHRCGAGSAIPPGRALSFLLGATCAVGLARLDMSLALPLVGLSALGIYAVAVSVVDVSTAVTQAIRAYILSSSVFGEVTLRRCLGTTIVCVGAGTVFALIGWLLCPDMIPLLFGNEFRDAVGVVQVLLVGMPAAFGISASAAFLVRMGRPRAQTVVFGGALIVDMLGMVVLSSLGAVGLAIAMAGAYWAGLLLSIVIVYSGRHSDTRL